MENTNETPVETNEEYLLRTVKNHEIKIMDLFQRNAHLLDRLIAIENKIENTQLTNIVDLIKVGANFSFINEDQYQTILKKISDELLSFEILP